jgi:hypothetical protein
MFSSEITGADGTKLSIICDIYFIKEFNMAARSIFFSD